MISCKSHAERRSDSGPQGLVGRPEFDSPETPFVSTTWIVNPVKLISIVFPVMAAVVLAGCGATSPDTLNRAEISTYPLAPTTSRRGADEFAARAQPGKRGHPFHTPEKEE